MRLFRIAALLLVLCPSAATAKKDQKPEGAPPGRLTADTFRGLAGDVPQISFRDLAIQRREGDLRQANVSDPDLAKVARRWWSRT